MTRIISIEDRKICYLRGKYAGKNIKVEEWDYCDLSGDIISNGVVKDEEGLVAVLQEFIHKNSLVKKDIEFLLTNNNVLLRELTLPEAKPKELSGIVYNEMLYSLGNMDEYTVDYIVLEKLADKQQRILAMALPNQLIDSYLAVAAQSGVKLAGINIAFNALAKMIAYSYPQYRTVVFLQITEQSVEICLLESGYCFLSRNVRLLINNFIANDSLDIFSEEISSHLNRVIQFQRSRSREQDVDSIIFLCDQPEGHKVFEALSGSLSIPCEFFDWEGGVACSGTAVPMTTFYTKAVGALIQRKNRLSK